MSDELCHPEVCNLSFPYSAKSLARGPQNWTQAPEQMDLKKQI